MSATLSWTDSRIASKMMRITLFKAFDEDRTYRGLPLASDDENLRGLTHSYGYNHDFEYDLQTVQPGSRRLRFYPTKNNWFSHKYWTKKMGISDNNAPIERNQRRGSCIYNKGLFSYHQKVFWSTAMVREFLKRIEIENSTKEIWILLWNIFLGEISRSHYFCCWIITIGMQSHLQCSFWPF